MKNKKSPASAATPTGETTGNQDEVILGGLISIIPPKQDFFNRIGGDVIEKS